MVYSLYFNSAPQRHSAFTRVRDLLGLTLIVPVFRVLKSPYLGLIRGFTHTPTLYFCLGRVRYVRALGSRSGFSFRVALGVPILGFSLVCRFGVVSGFLTDYYIANAMPHL